MESGFYRDEIYDPSTSDKGTAEPMVVKQRQGLTGTVKLRFFHDSGRFADLACKEARMFSQ